MPESGTTTIGAAEIRLASLFDRLAGNITNQPLQEQSYWPRIKRLMWLADNGLHPRAWVEELLREMP